MEKIKELSIARIESPGDFIEFANELISLGVTRHTYDLVEDCFYFYSKEALLLRLPRSKMYPLQQGPVLSVGDKLDKDKVQNAIDCLDNEEFSIDAFHQELAQAGVVYVSVYLDQQVIYYLGQDGNYFLETY